MIRSSNQSCQNQLNWAVSVCNNNILNAVNEDITEWSAKLYFIYWNDLIYYINNIDEHEYLCIWVCFEKKLFKLIYDQQHQNEFHCTYNQIFSPLFLHYLIKQLKKYIFHCSECKLNQTMQHKLYDSFQLISMLSISFYIIIINFILTLSLDNQNLNNLLTVINKFIKQVLLLSNRFIYTVVQWTNVFLLNFISHN